ncbi:hypothetical protein AVEN_178592-1 [Araneus ventricosus]|uniref:Uncharacterized protein n=1 Tax=Araneus ventricosus TaxID=182803 RepID=A0A4Y1ZL64_ARAVE|nr:hypothetical protein AVEN_223946-1 [Araneus ventricosus]GBL53940.1 hypothetical protein AVEN_178592-1 [Araneus ventricosus]
MYIFIDNFGSVIIEAHCPYVCRIQLVGRDELDVTGLRSTNLDRATFVPMVNDQFAVSESLLIAIVTITDCRTEVFDFLVVSISKKN